MNKVKLWLMYYKYVFMQNYYLFRYKSNIELLTYKMIALIEDMIYSVSCSGFIEEEVKEELIDGFTMQLKTIMDKEDRKVEKGLN